MSHVEDQSGNPILILLCTYNELGNLPELLRTLHAELPSADVLVVDDRSPDGTADWIRQRHLLDPWLHLLERPGKLGLGSATRDGIHWCLQRQYQFLIQMDADWSHRPSDVPQLFQACHQSNCDVSVGSRYLPGGGFRDIPWYRRMISWTLNRYATTLLRLPVTDCSGSFRCYRTSALRAVDWNRLCCDGYGFLEEILVSLHRKGHQIIEVPIWFEPRAKGISKLSLGDAWGAIQVIHRLAFKKH